MTDHTCLACGKIHDGAREVRLSDGRIVSSYSEAWRAETEALSILNLPTRTDRSLAISKIRSIRGEQAASDVEQRVREIWSYRRQPRMIA